jgi:stress response protein SCP2
MPALRKGENLRIETATLAAELSCFPDVLSGKNIDAAALLVTAKGRAREAVHHGRVRSDDGTVAVEAPLSWTPQRLSIDLPKIDAAIDKIVFLLALSDGTKQIGEERRRTGLGSAEKLNFTLRNAKNDVIAEFILEGKDVSERIVVMAELYRKGADWKLRAVGQGYLDGFPALSLAYAIDFQGAGPRPAHFEQSPEERRRKPENAPMPAQTNRETAATKERELGRQILVLDFSGSMEPLYRTKAIDEIVSKALAFAERLSGKRRIETFIFGSEAAFIGTVEPAVAGAALSELLVGREFMTETRYDVAIDAVRAKAASLPGARKTPTRVILVTDGDTAEKGLAERALQKASADPIFWSFVALVPPPRNERADVKPRGFRFLERVASLPGRLCANASSFIPENLIAISEEEFLAAMENGHAEWRKEAIEKRILVP